MKRKGFFKRVREAYRESSKSIFIVYIVLRILVIGVMIRQSMLGNYDNVLLCLITLIMFTVPYFINKTFKIEIPDLFQIIILIFIFAAEILGEMESYYVNIAHFDTVLHTITGFLAAAVGFALTDLLNNNSKKINLSPFYLALVSFCFSMTVGALWELYEFGMDNLFDRDMQKDRIINKINTVTMDPLQDNNVISFEDIEKSVIYHRDDDKYIVTTIEGGYLDIGIIDTMKDLLVNFIGALVFSIFGALYVNNRDKYKFVEKFTIKKVNSI